MNRPSSTVQIDAVNLFCILFLYLYSILFSFSVQTDSMRIAMPRWSMAHVTKYRLLRRRNNKKREKKNFLSLLPSQYISDKNTAQSHYMRSRTQSYQSNHSRFSLVPGQWRTEVQLCPGSTP